MPRRLEFYNDVTLDHLRHGRRDEADKSGALPDGISGISIDTRSIAAGEAFFAIQGDNRDGHDFVEAALKNGGGVAVIARAQRGTLCRRRAAAGRR